MSQAYAARCAAGLEAKLPSDSGFGGIPYSTALAVNSSKGIPSMCVSGLKLLSGLA
jgi:hypothetical protein